VMDYDCIIAKAFGESRSENVPCTAIASQIRLNEKLEHFRGT
jgi:hypothetical protein